MFIKDSLKVWENEICAKFVDYDENQHSSYLSFIKSKKCKSRLGKYQDGINVIRINTKCSKLTTIREIGHALGFCFNDEPGYKKLENRSEKTKKPGYVL
ncbi:hypothetical protein G9C98_003511 [Cotesia typhae]|uniref:Peptidase M12A domain-containing protein n=1 Tax=Cotesia typhae TaxID=2053667 RepID=A0A8J5RGB5_9HYME|nr:hypothetical protein G9C98_003511 [Cotesia typhae]